MTMSKPWATDSKTMIFMEENNPVTEANEQDIEREILKRHYSRIGYIGGRSTSEKKAASSRLNVLKAIEARKNKKQPK